MRSIFITLMANRDRRTYLLSVVLGTVLLLPARPFAAIVISELMFHPIEVDGTPTGEETLEYVELYNNRAIAEEIGGYGFTNGIEYTFPADTTIGGKAYIVVAKDPDALKAAYGISGVYGPFPVDSLNNDGERIELSDANGQVIISFRYNDGPPWYPAADGTGHSLVRTRFAGDPEQASSWAPSTYIGGTPGAADQSPPSTARLLINELLTNSDAGSGRDWVEIHNPSPVDVDLSNVYLSDGRFDLLNEYRFPNGLILQPGDFISVDQTALGFGLSSTGETVFLTQGTDDPQPRPLRVLDAVRFGTVEADITLGRYPDGSDNFLALSFATHGTPNSQPLQRDIVINEIMYQHGLRDPRYEFVELYNSGSSPVSLSGWTFTDGVEYEFPAAATIDAGSYLVVAADPQCLAGVYENLTVDTNLFGPYEGGLDDHSEQVRLSAPAVEVDPDTGKPYPITADEVTYYDGGRWPIWADGQGASLELRDPRSNNDSPDAWAPSDESAKSAWQPFSLTIDAADPDYTHDPIDTFALIMLNRGDVLVDDLKLIVNGSNRLANGGFEDGPSSWRFLGNHVQSFVTTEDSRSGSRSLHIRDTGHGDPGANRINKSIAQVTANTVTFTGWAKWLRGSRYLLLRTSRQLAPVQPPRPAYVCELAMPLDLGTPGAQNTAYTPNRGPDIHDIKHTPVVPAAYQPVTVTARISDNDGVNTATLYYRSEGQTTFTSTAMTDKGAGSDTLADDGIYTAVMPGATAGVMRTFYIVASDGAASTRFPAALEDTADNPQRTCLVRVADLSLDTAFATYRIWMSDDVVDTFKSRPNLSNEMLDCTFVYSDTEVFYNTKIRYRGSPYTRSGSNLAPVPGDTMGFRLDFHPDQQFRSRTEINLDGTEGSERGPLQERAAYWLFRKMGLQNSMQEYVWPVVNGKTHHTYEDVQKLNSTYIDAWFPADSDGYIHKVDDYFEYNYSGTSFKNLDEGLIYDEDHPLIKETYRWSFEKRSHREDDNWSHLLHLAEMMNTPPDHPDYETNIESVIDPARFMRALAVRRAIGDWDSYGFIRGKNNVFYYAPLAAKWHLLSWDIDYGFGSGAGARTFLFGAASRFPEVVAMMDYPKYRRMYEQALAELVAGPWQTSHGTAGPPTKFDKFLEAAANARIAEGLADQPFLDRYDEIKTFVAERRDYILEQLGPQDFEITTNAGLDFCAPQGQLTISGFAPPEVSQIAVNGSPTAAEFSDSNLFTLTVTVEIGLNHFGLQGLDGTGQPVADAADSITVTGFIPCSVLSVTLDTVCNHHAAQLTIRGTGFQPASPTQVTLTHAGVIHASSVVVRDENTITCLADLTGAAPGDWDVTVTPECGDTAAQCRAERILQIVDCTSDFNLDHRIDPADLIYLADLWLDPCPPPDHCDGADLDQSTRIDLPDLAILAAQWLKNLP